MQRFAFVVLMLVASLLSICASAQEKSGDMEGMPMNGMGDMNMGKPMAPAVKTHTATGIVKGVDKKASMVTVAHGPVPSLGWDAMTMSFAVKDKALLDKFVEGKKVQFDFVEKGDDYVVTAVK